MKTTLHIEGTPDELGRILKAINGKVDTSQEHEAPDETEEPEEAEQADEDESLFEQIKKTVAAKSQAGKKDAIKALLAKFKVTKLPELKEAQHQKFLTALNSI